jgi:triosephosphate isomerase
MQKKQRKYLIAGNWKMYKTTAEAKALVEEIVQLAGKQTDVGVAVCPPYTSLAAVSPILENSNVALGAQNLHPKAEGAYTGEISAQMLRDLYVSYVIIGHSERRQYFAETDASVNEKTHAALAASLKPIVCVGETIQEREAGRTLDVVGTQMRDGLKGLTADAADALVIAYEPVWAIGTGKTATPAMAQEVHAAIRKMLVAQLGEAGNKVRILYGGSMKPENAAELLEQPDIDGGLIGGASLKAKSFYQIIEAAMAKA